MKDPHANYWQIKNDDETGQGWAALQIMRQKPPGKFRVLCWLMLNPEQLRSLGAAAFAIAAKIDAQPEVAAEPAEPEPGEPPCTH